MDPPNPNRNPADAQAGTRLTALSLRGSRDLPPDFHTTEIHDHHTDDDDDEGNLTAASRGGSSTCVWKEGLRDDDKDGDDVSPPSSSSSSYAGEWGSSLDDDPEPEPDPEPAQDCPGDKKHLHEDNASSSWRKRKKHFFILSHSGKPIYSRRETTANSSKKKILKTKTITFCNFQVRG